MAIPNKLPEWDKTEFNIVEVDDEHKEKGWLAPGGIPEKPPFQSFNWWQNLVYKWILRFKNVTGGLDNVTELLSFPEAVDGTSVNVRGLSAKNDGGGDIFNYDSNIDKSNANGETILDPSQTLPNQGKGSGLGCWVRQNLDNFNYSSNWVKEYDLFVIYGEANSVGLANSTVGRNEIPNNSYFWNDRTRRFEVISYTMEFLSYTSTGNAWIEFAREYRKKSGRGVLYLPASYKNKTISQLSKGSPDYNAMSRAINNMNTDTTYNIANKYLLFCQGESDMINATPVAQYESLLSQLWTDMKSDFGLTRCFISQTGNPHTADEVDRYPIIVGQNNFARLKNDVSIAFDCAGSFTVANGLLQADGVIYTQRGYNLMGSQMGKNVANIIIDNSTSSGTSLGLYKGIITPTDVEHYAVSATLYNDGSNWILENLTSSSEYRAVNISSIRVEDESIVLSLPIKTTDIITLQSQVNDVGLAYGLSCSLISTGKNLELKLRANVNAFVNMTDGSVSYGPAGTGTDTGLLADIVGDAPLDKGYSYVKLTHAGCNNAPIATSISSSAFEFNEITSYVVSDKEFRVRYNKTNDGSSLVSFIGKLVKPNLVTMNGLRINIFAIIGERV